MFLAYTALGGKSQGQLLVLGLSHENLKRLKEGKPIFLERKSHGLAIPEGMKICLFAGETEETMADQMKTLIGPLTVINQKESQ